MRPEEYTEGMTELHNKCADALDSIRPNFKYPDNYKFTIVCRCTDHNLDADVIVTDDDLSALCNAIKRLENKD